MTWVWVLYYWMTSVQKTYLGKEVEWWVQKGWRGVHHLVNDTRISQFVSCGVYLDWGVQWMESATCERGFSIRTLTKTGQRYWLGDSLLAAVMMIDMNGPWYSSRVHSFWKLSIRGGITRRGAFKELCRWILPIVSFKELCRCTIQYPSSAGEYTIVSSARWIIAAGNKKNTEIKFRKFCNLEKILGKRRGKKQCDKDIQDRVTQTNWED